jgi:hypothetical protein
MGEEWGSHIGPPCFLLVAWESYMTPSCTAMHILIATRVRGKKHRLDVLLMMDCILQVPRRGFCEP